MSQKTGYGTYQIVHYECFNQAFFNSSRVSVWLHDKRSNKPQQLLFLTYKGILKVLFASRTGNAESFQDWAVMGTQENKDKLGAELLKTDAECIILICSSDAKTPNNARVGGTYQIVQHLFREK